MTDPVQITPEQKAAWNTQIVKALTSFGTMVLGVGTVITLALTKVIADGETIAALSAVMSATTGMHALNRKNET